MKKKRIRRSEIENPGLEKKWTLPIRQDYFEVDYVDGVVNDSGDLVIRPLNQEEKNWLNKFQEEYVNANMLHDKELYKIHRKIKELEKIEKPTDQQLEDHMYLKFLYIDRANETQLHKGVKNQKKISDANNFRNSCIYNRAKTSGKLMEYITEIYDEDNYEYHNYLLDKKRN